MILFFIFSTIFLSLIIFKQHLNVKRLENETFECFKIQKKNFDKIQHSTWKEIQKLWDIAEDFSSYRTNSGDD
jgi:hypothetical protein